jgi:hypothetical protein
MVRLQMLELAAVSASVASSFQAVQYISRGTGAPVGSRAPR